MRRTPHDVVYSDHRYLWAIGPAFDMTGGYVDQEDLARLLQKPTKSTAVECLVRQIGYWFQTGPDVSEKSRCRQAEVRRLIETDPEVRRIHQLYVGPLAEEEGQNDGD